jgi:deoxyribodipyrimidine photo-lyase
MRTIVVLFTRDLRVHDNPVLAQACRNADAVVPLFVTDPALCPPPNRARFLRDSLADLRSSLRVRGGDLLIRRGDPVAEAIKVCRQVKAEGIGMAADHSRYAQQRQRRLAAACEQERVTFRSFPGVTIVEPGRLRPSTGGDHYKVFTPYWRGWTTATWRAGFEAPETIRLPDRLSGDDPDEFIEVAAGGSPDLVPGGETAALRRWDDWLDRAPDYAAIHDDLATDDTTRMSAYLHFGCVSPLAMAADDRTPEALVRQLCWRDFYTQVLAAFPALTTRNYRPGSADDWQDDQTGLQAWQSGNTGVALVDAGMRQLQAQGWMHNRARLVTASYLTKNLNIDWRLGAAWFDRWLVDADVANNYGNWQWTAGTGNDSKPYRRFNPDRQAQRFDPDEIYRARWLNG